MDQVINAITPQAWGLALGEFSTLCSSEKAAINGKEVIEPEQLDIYLVTDSLTQQTHLHVATESSGEKLSFIAILTITNVFLRKPSICSDSLYLNRAQEALCILSTKTEAAVFTPELAELARRINQYQKILRAARKERMRLYVYELFT